MPRPLIGAPTTAAVRKIITALAEGNGVTVTLRAPIGVDGSNQPRYSAPTTHAAFVTLGNEEVAGANGERVLAKGSVLFSFPAPTVTLDMAITVDGVDYDIVAVAGDAGSNDPFVPTVVKFS